MHKHAVHECFGSDAFVNWNTLYHLVKGQKYAFRYNSYQSSLNPKDGNKSRSGKNGKASFIWLLSFHSGSYELFVCFSTFLDEI